MDITTLLKTCSIIISHSLSQGIVSIESGGHPYKINVNTDPLESYTFKTHDEAVIYAKKLIADGYSIDMGLAQINIENLESLNLSVNKVFDPCTNLNAMQTVFLRGYDLSVDKSLTAQEKEIAAISRYNTGNSVNGINNGYVYRVLSARLVAENQPAIAPPISQPVEIINDNYESVPDGYSNARSRDE